MINGTTVSDTAGSSAEQQNPPTPTDAREFATSIRRPERLIWLFLAVFFAAKIPTLGLPYHWDEAGAYMSIQVC